MRLVGHIAASEPIRASDDSTGDASAAQVEVNAAPVPVGTTVAVLSGECGVQFAVRPRDPRSMQAAALSRQRSASRAERSARCAIRAAQSFFRHIPLACSHRATTGMPAAGLEIEAAVPAGVPNQVVRIVTENSRTLKFTSHGFEQA